MTANVRVDAAARFQSSIAGRIKLRNTLPPLASNDLFDIAVQSCSSGVSMAFGHEVKNVTATAIKSAMITRWPNVSADIAYKSPALSIIRNTLDIAPTSMNAIAQSFPRII